MPESPQIKSPPRISHRHLGILSPGLKFGKEKGKGGLREPPSPDPPPWVPWESSPFCPVPLSAPHGYPELYQLASFDDEGRKMASLQVRRNIEFAASVGADVLVLHAGRVMCRGWIKSRDILRRTKRGQKMCEVFKRELDALAPVLEKSRVTLGLENLPYLEGFPAEWEMQSLVGEWVKPWFDTGHDRVRKCRGWTDDGVLPSDPVGLHINDVVDKDDDHLAPGMGNVDFVALRGLAETARHVVFEPNDGVSEEDLKKGVDYLKNLWK